MELKVYNWEYFERWKTWYLKFALVILLVVVLSILSKNIVWWVFVLIVVAWYIYYTTKVNDTVSIVINESALQISKTAYSRESLKWFVLEYHTKKKKIHNIVIIDNKNEVKVHTIKDTEKNLEKFVRELSEYIPMLDKYDLSSFDKLVRRLKL